MKQNKTKSKHTYRPLEPVIYTSSNPNRSFTQAVGLRDSSETSWWEKSSSRTCSSSFPLTCLIKEVFKRTRSVLYPRNLQRKIPLTLTHLLLFSCLFLEGAVKYLVLMIETRTLNISWWSSQHQRVPPFGVNPGFFSFSISKGHLGSMMSAQSSQAETSQKRIPSGCFAFSPASEKDSCSEEADFLRICVTSTYPADQPNREQGGGALEDFGGGVTMFSGEKRWRSVVANRTS